MRRPILRLLAPVLALTSLLAPAAAADVPVELRFAPGSGDAALAVRTALEGVETRSVRLVFAPGRYVFDAANAREQYLAITNHDNGPKRIAFPMDRFDSVEIEGNGAEFVFRGRILPFLFSGCRSVVLADVTIDWEIPYYLQAAVRAVDPVVGRIDIVPATEGFSWRVRDERLEVPAIDGYSYQELGETLAFDPVHRRVAHGAWDFHLAPSRVETLPDGALRLHASPRHFPEVGTVIVAKGRMGENRYAPAVHGIGSGNLWIRNVTVHHALGMGFLFERCENVVLTGCRVEVRPGSDRLVSALADATHFANCRGEVLVEYCRFRHMLDDGTNVHGTYVVVDEVLGDHEVRVRFGHFQQAGFRFAAPGDEVWLVRAPDPSRGSRRTVTEWAPEDEIRARIRFDAPISGELRPGDLLENATWNPTFTMRGCVVRDHRARGVVLKTPLPILIEDNEISSMMSAVFLRGESRYWYESGAVQDVLVRNNRFDHCAYGGMDHAVLTVTPRLGEAFDATVHFDRNIRFERNRIRTFGNRLVWADRVAGLRIADNDIVQTREAPVLHPEAPMIDLARCVDVRIEGNRYEGPGPRSIVADAISARTLVVGDNPGFAP